MTKQEKIFRLIIIINIRVVWMIDATKTMDKKEEKKNASFVGLNSCQSVDTDVLSKNTFQAFCCMDETAKGRPPPLRV